MNEFDEQVAAVSALSDRTRKTLYDFVRDQAEPVSRDAAAAALDLPRHQVKFHLDRLEEAGLLEADYVRLTGRSGPGAGRPAKVYRRASADVAVSVPQREYEFAAELMAGAISESITSGDSVQALLQKRSRAAGAALAERLPQDGDPLTGAGEVLTGLGYEPRLHGDTVEMANCPFHSLATEHTDLVCSLNHDLLDGFCACAGGLQASLDPAPHRCCVTLTRR